MAVETLIIKKGVQIKDVEIAAGEKKPESEAKRLYIALQRTPLYDEEDKGWNGYMTEQQDRKNSGRTSYDQLLGIMVEGLFDTGTAKSKYESLKETKLYDTNKKQWNWYMSKDQSNYSSVNYSFYQHLGVLTEYMFDERSALEQYSALQQTPLYDKERNQWNSYIKESNNYVDNERYASPQLSGIFIESLIDKKKAYEQYENLKETSLFDEERKLWYTAIDKNQEVNTNNFHTEVQLLGILVEGIFDKKNAREQYKQLKQSGFYDPERDQWNDDENLYGNFDSTLRTSSNHLLAILVEHALEEKQFVQQQELLPHVRKF